jgi:hypothetical protein
MSECSGRRNTYFNVARLPKPLISPAYTKYVLNEIHIRIYNFIFRAFSLADVETSQCFVQSHVLLTRWIAQVFLAALRNKCVLFSFSLEEIIPQNCSFCLPWCHISCLHCSGLIQSLSHILQAAWRICGKHFFLNLCNAVLSQNLNHIADRDHVNM